MYSGINRLMGNLTPRLSAIKDKDGKTLTENEEISNRWKEYRSEMYEDNTNEGIKQVESNDEILEPEIHAEMIKANGEQESIMRDVEAEDTEDKYSAIKLNENLLTELRYADDAALLSKTTEGLNELLQNVKKFSQNKNLLLNQRFVAAIAVLVLLCPYPGSSQTVNVALKKPVTAKYTCGIFGKESYNTLTDATDSVASRSRRNCVDARQPGPNRPDLVARVRKTLTVT
ncbi:hypothetical protein ElyMa_000345700 [Elysia marginata]|uniref:Uncharacterized protein n=1 Tax=Elysia marginata TaxID=1093978 RepID=A0AAV4FDM3_9GAST|nr:hypothetical protein ElyMa_000345700 [Elysia marginata]